MEYFTLKIKCLSIIIICSLFHACINFNESDNSRSEIILFDASHCGGVWWFPQYDSIGYNKDEYHQGKILADYIRSKGFKVDELARGHELTDSLLNQYDLVIRVGGYIEYTPKELEIYTKFIKKSHRFVLISEFLGSNKTDNLADELNIPLRGSAKGSIYKFADTLITKGQIQPLYYMAGSAIIDTTFDPSMIYLAWLDSNTFVDLNNNEIKDSIEPVGTPIMGIKIIDSTYILFTGDLNYLEMKPNFIIDNMINWAFE